MNRHFHHTFLPLLLLPLLSNVCHAQNGTLLGTLKHGDEYLAGATITVAQQNLLSDENGAFSIRLLEGHYNIRITMAGYQELTALVDVVANDTVKINLNLNPSGSLGEVVVTGSRSFRQRSNMQTPVPVDLVTAQDLKETRQNSVAQMLNFIVPSFNASTQMFNEPATLRGLDPDHTLLLLNGTRYHNMAWLNAGGIRGQLGRGSVGNDLNSIPFSAIDKIEILRDGASAQYGSDAIAGVINIHLKENTNKMELQAQVGQYYKGDGQTVLVGINQGIDLHKRGFISVSADCRYQAPTLRGGLYDGTVYKRIPKNASPADSLEVRQVDDSIINARKFSRGKVLSNVGNSKFTNAGILFNSGYRIKGSTSIFFTGAYNQRWVSFRGLYHFPHETSLVNTLLYPDGFKVKINTSTSDISAIAGIKGHTNRDWHWEISSSLGSNSVSNNISNTNNASQSYLGMNAPTQFYLGKQEYRQLTNNANLVRNFKLHGPSLNSLNFAMGAEWRIEKYVSKVGEPASWKNFDPTGLLNGGSVGFIGVSPADEVNKSRNVAAGYLDMEATLFKNLLADFAGRYEYYSDYGGNLSGKLAIRYKISDKLSLRASVSNGFHAPALQQFYLSSTQIIYNPTINGREAATRGIFPNDDPVTKAMGISKLVPEQAKNFGAGITASPFPHLNITLDAYCIEIRKRIVLSGVFDRTTNSIIDSILFDYPKITKVTFFTNAINTRTNGWDLVLNSDWRIRKGSFNAMLAMNFTQTRLFGGIKTSEKIPPDTLNTNALFNIEERAKIENGQPRSKIILALNYRLGKLSCLLRNTRFGNTSTATIVSGTDQVLYENFNAKILTDLEFRFEISKWLNLSTGVNNIFNVYPDPIKNYDNTNQGIMVYSNDASQFGYNGGFYWLGLSLRFL